MDLDERVELMTASGVIATCVVVIIFATIVAIAAFMGWRDQ